MPTQMNQTTPKAARRFVPIPKMRIPSEKDFDSFCDRHELNAASRALVKERLSSLCDYVNLRQPFHMPAEAEKGSLIRAAKYSKALRAELVSMTGPMGIGVGNSLTRELKRLAGLDWLRHGLETREDGTSQKEDAAKVFPALGIEVMAQKTALYLLFNLLKTFEGGVSEIIETNKTRKIGRKPKQLREVILVNLALIYEELGKKPTAQPDSLFTEFAADFFGLVGWESQTSGFDDAIPAALHAWKNYGDY